MRWVHHLFIAVFIVSLSVSNVVTAQTMQRRIGGISQIGTFANQPILQPFISPFAFPQPIVIPLVDLDLFALSTLQPSTLSTYAGRPSNLVVNPFIQDVIVEGEGKREDDRPLVIFEGPGIEYSLLPPRTSEEFYRWVDENGVLHITNDLESVPPKYRPNVEIR